MSDEEIPKAPINLRIYAWTRSKLSPQHTVKYITAEALIFGVIVLGLMYTFVSFDPIIFALTGVGYLLIPILLYTTTEPEKRNFPSRAMNISSITFFVLGSLISLSIIGYGYVNETILPSHITGGVAIIAYILSLLYRSRKYTGERDYFTDQYSSASKDWERASIALEQALDNREDNIRQSYYWAKRAESIYEEIIEKEDRIVQQEAASAFSVACGFIAASVFTKSNESYSLWQAAERSIEQAMEFLSVRVCDNCGRKKPVENCTGTIEDGSRRIYCSECVQRQETEQRKKAKQQRATNSSNRTQQRTYNTDQSTSRKTGTQDSSSQNNSRDRTRNTSTSSSRNNRSNRTSTDQGTQRTSQNRDLITVEEALDVLDLDEVPSNTEKVHGAFRKKVKEAHPDMGGSQEKFKKVKKARELLVDEV